MFESKLNVMLLPLVWILVPPSSALGQFGMGSPPVADRVDFVAFAGSGTFLVGAGYNKIRIWSFEPSRLVRTITTEHAIGYVAVAPKGTLLAVRCYRGICLWDIETGELSKTLPVPERFRLRGLAVSPDGTHLASVQGESHETEASVTIRLWDVERGVETRSFVQGPGRDIRAIAFAPDGATIAVGIVHDWGTRSEWTEIRLIGTGCDQPERTLGRTKTAVRDLVFSPDGRLLGAAGGRYTSGFLPTRVEEVSVWSVSDEKRLWWAEGPHQSLVRPVFSPDGKWIAGISWTESSSPDANEIVIRDIDTGRIHSRGRIRTRNHLDKYSLHSPGRIAYSPDPSLLAACSGQRLVILDTSTLAVRETLWPLPAESD